MRQWFDKEERENENEFLEVRVMLRAIVMILGVLEQWEVEIRAAYNKGIEI